MGTEEKSRKPEAPGIFLPYRGMRKPREIQTGAAYHVVARANRSEFILESKENKEMFMNVFLRAKKKFNFRLNHFVVMGNHIHLLIVPLGETNLSDLMQWILGVFAKRYNWVYKLKGHIWYDRFKSKVIRSFGQFFNTFLYISNNPVKALLCEKPEDYHYSGVRYRKKNRLKLLDPPDIQVKICLKSL